MSYILFDIGGTNTRVAVSEDLKKFDNIVKFKTPKKFDDGIVQIVEAAKKLAKGNIRMMAGGTRGTLSEDKTGIVRDSVLIDWVDKPLTEQLGKLLETKVLIENDTAVVGLGEAHFGAGKDADILAYHTVSTGVGGVKIEQGEVDSYTDGFEPGHQIIDIDRTVLGSDVVPTLENLVSGAALEARTGQKPYDIPQSDAVWDQLAGYLASGLRNTILYWSPDMIVLGGSMIVGDPRILLDDIRRHTEEVLDGFVECPLIVDAELGDTGGLYGALVLIEQNV